MSVTTNVCGEVRTKRQYTLAELRVRTELRGKVFDEICGDGISLDGSVMTLSVYTSQPKNDLMADSFDALDRFEIFPLS